MRALVVTSPGTAPTVTEAATPAAAPGTVLVAVKAAGLNAIDAGIAAGALAEMIPHEYPLVVGRDAAGVVEAVGEGVEGISVGAEVAGTILLAPPVSSGTVAEHAALSGATVVTKPSTLSWEQAAAVPLAGAAAVQAVQGADVATGQTVLVSGASGGVGSYVVQLLAANGVTVVATGTPGDADRLRELGATAVVDWSAGDVAEQVRTLFPDGVDALIELANHSVDAAPLAAVKSGGTVATTTGIMQSAGAVSEAGLRLFGVMASPTSDVVGPLLDQAANGQLRIDVGTVLPLERAAEGLATLGSGGARGKIVVRVAA